MHPLGNYASERGDSGDANIRMNATLVIDTSVDYAEIAPDTPDVRNKHTVRREDTLVFHCLGIQLEPLLRHTLADDNRRRLRGTKSFTELIRGPVVNRKVFHQLAILCLQGHRTRHDDTDKRLIFL